MEATRKLSAATYNEASAMHSAGLLSPREWRQWRLFWLWSAPRFSFPFGAAQDRYHERHGRAAYLRRMNRVRRALGVEPLRDPAP